MDEAKQQLPRAATGAPAVETASWGGGTRPAPTPCPPRPPACRQSPTPLQQWRYSADAGATPVTSAGPTDHGVCATPAPLDVSREPTRGPTHGAPTSPFLAPPSTIPPSTRPNSPSFHLHSPAAHSASAVAPPRIARARRARAAVTVGQPRLCARVTARGGVVAGDVRREPRACRQRRHSIRPAAVVFGAASVGDGNRPPARRAAQRLG